MDWMKVEKSTPRKPEVLEMAAILDADPDDVFGKLFRLWAWADDNTEDGNARGVTSALLDLTIGVTGFAAAMMSVGWLEQIEQHEGNQRGGVRFVNFDRHNGQTAKRRALTAARVAKHKTRPVSKGNALSVSESVTDALPREEKRREENKDTHTHTRARTREQTPLERESKTVRDAVAFWNRYWSETHGCGKPDADSRIDAMLAQARAAGWDDAKIADAVRASVGWNAKSWRDPEANHDELAKTRAAGRSAKNGKRAAELSLEDGR